jgi:hypothetical protein
MELKNSMKWKCEDRPSAISLIPLAIQYSRIHWRTVRLGCSAVMNSISVVLHSRKENQNLFGSSLTFISCSIRKSHEDNTMIQNFKLDFKWTFFHGTWMVQPAHFPIFSHSIFLLEMWKKTILETVQTIFNVRHFLDKFRFFFQVCEQ